MFSSKKNFLRLVALFYPHKIKIFFALISLMVTALAILFYGFVAKNFVNEINIGDAGEINSFFLSFVLLTAILAVSGYFRSYLINDVSLLAENELRRKIFAKILKFPVEFFDNNPTGDVLSRVSSDISEIFSAFTKNTTFFLRNLALFVGSILFLLAINASLFAVMILVIFLSLLPIFYLARKMKKTSTASKEKLSFVFSFVKESLYFIKVIKSFNAQAKSSSDFAKLSDDSLVLERKRSAFLSLLIAVAIFFAFFSVALMLYLGAGDVLNGKMSGGDFSSFVFYAVILSVALVGLAQSFSQILSVSQNSRRVFELFDGDVEDDSGRDLDELAQGCVIEFRGVNFTYPSKKENLVLRNLSFKINRGQKVQIVGESGCGKSSIFSLLLRFYDFNGGEILVNGQSIRGYNLGSLRRNFSYVMQENFIFSGTIYQNIAYSNSDLTKDQLNEIVSSSKAFDFVSGLEGGIDADVGNMGARLSGGQKQRIAILRAILSDSQILILDEATSALDEKNEQLMIDLVNEFALEKTVIFVSHREIKGMKFDQKINL